MTCAFAWPLQQALFAALRSRPDVAALATGGVHDAPPHAGEGAPGPYVLLGDETVEPWGAADARGAAHLVQISVIGPDHGFAALKRLAAIVCDVGLGPLSLSRGRVVVSHFLGARARRVEAHGLRQIEMRLRIVIEDEN
ncbi:MAG: DUF3168 domain-containing protein [Rubrimonas sp.]